MLILTLDRLAAAGLPELTARRLLRKIKPQKNDCWHYCGSKDDAGKPVFGFKSNGIKQHHKLHRLLYSIAYPGTLQKGVHLMPSCGDRGCVNPEHQDQLTRSQLMLSADPAVLGSKKLNWELVHKIRKLPATANLAQVARLIGVSRNTIYRIVHGRAWVRHAA